MKTRRSMLLLLIAALTTGCAFVSKIHVTMEPGSGTPAAVTAADPELVGVALSGGGSRASVYAAAGLEAFWEHGVLEGVDYISSVSGGSIAASYYIRKTVHDGEAIDGAFFERFRIAMRDNFWKSIEWRQCYKIRWTSATRRATSLNEVLDHRFLDGLTVGDLEGTSPTLLVNTTLYDTGQRFVVTTLGQDDLDFDFRNATNPGRELADRTAVRVVTFAHPRVLGAVPEDLPLSLAVASSASVPLLLGPVTIRIGDDYRHLGDAGMWWDPDELIAKRNFWVSKHAFLLVDIPMARADAYHEVAWKVFEEGPNRDLLEKTVMRYTTAALDPATLPSSCADEPDLCPEESCRNALVAHLSRIPTHLKITECDADLMELAAHAAVHEQLSERFPQVRECRFGG